MIFRDQGRFGETLLNQRWLEAKSLGGLKTKPTIPVSRTTNAKSAEMAAV